MPLAAVVLPLSTHIEIKQAPGFALVVWQLVTQPEDTRQGSLSSRVVARHHRWVISSRVEARHKGVQVLHMGH